MTTKTWVTAAAVGFSLALAGCGNSDTGGTTKPAEATKAAETTTAPSASAPAAEPAPKDATAYAELLKAKVGTVTEIVTITEDNDPNDMLGRPNGYTSAAVIKDAAGECPADGIGIDCGATIEYWPDEAAATQRGEYVITMQKAIGGLAGSEWDRVKGNALLRVSGKLKPSQAQPYLDAFGGTEIKAKDLPSSSPSS